jgi:hypothetical protein
MGIALRAELNDELRSGLIGPATNSIAAFLSGPDGRPLLRVEDKIGNIMDDPAQYYTDMPTDGKIAVNVPLCRRRTLGVRSTDRFYRKAQERSLRWTPRMRQ